jgi:hypothetical protein
MLLYLFPRLFNLILLSSPNANECRELRILRPDRLIGRRTIRSLISQLMFSPVCMNRVLLKAASSLRTKYQYIDMVHLIERGQQLYTSAIR